MQMDKLPSPATARKPRRRLASSNSADQLDKAISRIYDAAADSQLWPKALAEILRFVGNSGTHLWLMNAETSEVTHSIHVGMPDKMIEEYNGEVIKECPRWANARKHPDRTFLFDYQHIAEDQIDSNEYYHWLQTKGDHIRYYLGGRLHIGNDLEGFQSLAFRKQEGHSQKKHLERFSRVLPHVQRAMKIGQQLGTWQFDAQSSLEFISSLACGVVILDETGKNLAVNQYAEHLLKGGYRILLKRDRLEAFDTAVNQQLNLLIGQCAATSRGKGEFPGGTVSVPADKAGTYLRLHVYPLKLRCDTFNNRCAVVVFFKEPMKCEYIDSATLRTIFGLTVAESRLTVLLLDGATTSAASRKLNLSTHTVRSQLKSVFMKVGVHRQAELMRVLLPLAIGPRAI
jgi:DNA-binding CsgD family transcriptional regulator